MQPLQSRNRPIIFLCSFLFIALSFSPNIQAQTQEQTQTQGQNTEPENQNNHVDTSTLPTSSLPVPSLPFSPTNKLEELQIELYRLKAQQDSMQKQTAQLASQIKSLQIGSDMVSSGKKIFGGFGVAASKVYLNETPLTVGASAELFFLSLQQGGQGPPLLNTWKLAPHLGYRISSNIIFNSRLAIENSGAEVHAGGSPQRGQVRVELAYVDISISSTQNLRIGQQLLPIGLANQKQEGIFYDSVHPPEVESELIPSTWSEQGVTLWGNNKKKDFHYQVALYNSLDSQKFKQGTFIKGGRQSGQLSKAKDLAGVTRLDYISPWFTVGASGFIGNTAQGNSIINRGTLSLAEAHLQTSFKSISLSALAVISHIQNADSISLAIIGTPDIPRRAHGYYVTAAIDFLDLIGGSSSLSSLSSFVRYSQYNLNSAMPSGLTPDPRLNRTRTTIGLNYRPEKNIAFKMDYQIRKNQQSNEANQFSLGISLAF